MKLQATDIDLSLDRRARIKMNKEKCKDCKEEVIREYYMVWDEIWENAGMKCDGGQLCIGCLEKRIGRELVPDDFLEAPINDGYRSSDRLLDRLGLLNKGELKELKKSNPKAAAAYARLKHDRDGLLSAYTSMRCEIEDILSNAR